MARASAALRGTIRPTGGSLPVSASGPARGAPGHRRHCRVGPAEQFRRTSRWVTAFSGDSQAMDKQPGQRQCDGQQQPGPQPGRQENPHAERPFFFSPPGGRPLAGRRLIGGTSYRIELCTVALPLTRLAAQPGVVSWIQGYGAGGQSARTARPHTPRAGRSARRQISL